MRGGTSKGVFFHAGDLPQDAVLRDQLLLRITGSPDPYCKQIDGMGSATSSTSKVVLISKSQRPDCDVDYFFGAVSIDTPLIDWSGNCGHLTSAVGPFAISEGLVKAGPDGVTKVRIWQGNIKKCIHAYVPTEAGQVVEEGSFELDGVTFPSAEIRLEFLDPGGTDEGLAGAMFPTGNKIDVLEIPGLGKIEATLINAGNPTIFVAASTLGLQGTELQTDINHLPDVLQRAELLRSHAAVTMGLVKTPQEASQWRPHTPKLAFLSKPQSYTTSAGKPIDANSIDLLARIFSMGQLHHAMTGSGAVAIAVAAAIPGTLLSNLLKHQAQNMICFGHPSGTLKVGADAGDAHKARFAAKRPLRPSCCTSVRLRSAAAIRP